jgi:hypothetical protein
MTQDKITTCYYSPTGKSYEDDKGRCSCIPVTPGLDGKDREFWLKLNQISFRLNVLSSLENIGEISELAEELADIRDQLFPIEQEA